MKKVNLSVLRILVSLLLGLVLVFWPQSALHYLIITIGILFILPGFFSVLNYLLRDKATEESKSSFPLEGAGSIILGAFLAAIPDSFVNIFMYVLSILVIIGGIQQLVDLTRANKKKPVQWGFYVVPVLLVISGFVIISDPGKFLAYILKIFGIVSLVYSLTSFIIWIKVRKIAKEGKLSERSENLSV